MFDFEKLKQFFQISCDNEKSILGRIKTSFSNLKSLFNRLTQHEKTFIITLLLLVIICGPWVVGKFYMFGQSFVTGKYPIDFAMNLETWRYFVIGCTMAAPWTATLIFLICGFTMVFIIMRSSDLSQIAETDERGVNFADSGTYGTARWMSKEEAASVYDVGDVHDATGYILGQFTRQGDGTKDCISLPTNSGGNQNYMVIGSPGKGKTFSFGFNAVLQALVRNESIVIVDPKGELCEKLFDTCVEKGYNTKVYNLVDPTHSNAWNFANEIFNPNTGNLDSSRLTAFVNIIMTNTVEGDKEDPFWGSGEKNLFTAATGYLGWKHEITYAENLRRSADDWRHVDLSKMSEEDREQVFDIIEDEKSTIRDIELALRTIMRVSGLVSEDEITSYLREICEASDPISIDRIFALFVKNDLDALIAMFDSANIPASHPAAITWSIFKHGDKKIQPNFVQGLTQRLMLFANTDINSMSAHNDIDFRSLGETKTALFCIISASDSSRKLLSSLFFSFLFRDVAEAADELGPENRIPVNVMCDEFANIGKIPDFDRFISTVRSRKIYLSIIIQSVAQLAKVYDENDQETIMECCDTIVFLGCNGIQTAQFISELSGVASIITSSIKDQRNISGMRGIAQGYSTSDGAGKRYLVNPDEAMKLDPEAILIYHSGYNMLRAYRCGYIFHPYAKDIKKGRKLSTFPSVTDMYGEYHDIFGEISVKSLSEQKVHNEVTARLRAAGISAETSEVNHARISSFVPPTIPNTNMMADMTNGQPTPSTDAIGEKKLEAKTVEKSAQINSLAFREECPNSIPSKDAKESQPASHQKAKTTQRTYPVQKSPYVPTNPYAGMTERHKKAKTARHSPGTSISLPPRGK